MNRKVFVSGSNRAKSHYRIIDDKATSFDVALFSVPVNKKRFGDSLVSDLLGVMEPFFGEISDSLRKAVEFGVNAHGGQERKYSGEPYIYHPVEVACLLKELDDDCSEAELVACVLHDVVEDTDVSSETIYQVFGEEVGDIVKGLTDVYVPDGVRNRKERKRLEAERLRLESVSVQKCKLVDMLHNTVSIVENDPGFSVVYLREKKALLEKLTKIPESLLQEAQTIENSLL